MNIEWSFIALLFGLVLTIWNVVDKISAKGSQNATVVNSLEVLRTGNASIQSTLDKMELKQEKHGERITRVEESCKSAHHRLDGLEGRHD